MKFPTRISNVHVSRIEISRNCEIEQFKKFLTSEKKFLTPLNVKILHEYTNVQSSLYLKEGNVKPI